MKDVSNGSTVSKAIRTNNFYKKMDQFKSNMKIFKSLLLRYLKLKTI